jgi:hypothetical protein
MWEEVVYSCHLPHEPVPSVGRDHEQARIMFTKNFILAVLAVSYAGSAAAASTDSPKFPRLGGYLIGSPQTYEDSRYQTSIARLNLAIINTWPSWRGYSRNGTTLQQAVTRIKGLNPNIRIFQYEIMDALGESNAASAGTFHDLYAKLQANSWWLYSARSNSRVLSNWQSGGGGPFYVVNTTEFVRPESNGDRWPQWFAKWAVSTYMTPAPALDGLFTDDVSWKPLVTGAWNLGPTNNDSGSASVQQSYRQGFADFFAQLRSLMPDKLLLANLANWGDPRSNLSGLSGQVNGGVIEGLIGPNWAVETWGGWDATLAWYRKAMASVLMPKLVIFHQMGLPTDYQAMRYGLATCLMDDGYYQFVSTASSSGGDYHAVMWFDEYDANLGGAIAAPPTAAWQSGVYRRDFQGGIALVNPKGNGLRTVLLESAFVKISGKQAPNINNGQTVTTVTLQDRDGIILLRPAAPKQPTAP